jgi:hypothetical protein
VRPRWRAVAVAASSPPQPSSVLLACEAERSPRRGDAAMEGSGAGVGRPRREDQLSLLLKRMKVRQFHRFTSRSRVFTPRLRTVSAGLHPPLRSALLGLVGHTPPHDASSNPVRVLKKIPQPYKPLDDAVAALDHRAVVPTTPIMRPSSLRRRPRSHGRRPVLPAAREPLIRRLPKPERETDTIATSNCNLLPEFNTTRRCGRLQLQAFLSFVDRQFMYVNQYQVQTCMSCVVLSGFRPW